MSATENWCSWYGAYAFAFSSSLLFLFVTLLSYVFGPFDVDTMSSLCLLYFASSILNFVLFVVAGFELAAVSFFVLGSGLFYGAGAAATGLGGSYYFETFYTHEDQTFLFTKVCMLNAISTSLILLIVGCYVRPTVATFIGSAENIAFDRWIEKIGRSALLIGVPVSLALPYWSFSSIDGFLANALTLFFKAFALGSIVINAMQLDRLTFVEKILLFAVVSAMTFYGCLTLSKLQVIAPVGCVILGLLVNRKNPRLLALLVLAVAISYPVAVVPVISISRLNVVANPDSSVAERVEVLQDTVELLSRVDPETARTLLPIVQRFGFLPEQAFLVFYYDHGMRGNSLDAAWVALVPRIMWPNKPIVTKIGNDFDALFFQRISNSQLAPSFVGEAYWSWGLFGVIVVSVLIGLEVAWLTQHWAKFRSAGYRYGGIFLLVPLIGQQYFAVGNAVAASYVGGFVALAVQIVAINMLLSYALNSVVLVSQSETNNASAQV